MPTATVAAVELKRVIGTICKNVDLSLLVPHNDLDYKWAQILGNKGWILIQLTFLSKVDAPIALCIMRSNKPEIGGIRIATMQGMSSASWSKAGYEYILIGGIDTALIKQVAEQFADRLSQ